jgi:hypothetical protein
MFHGEPFKRKLLSPLKKLVAPDRCPQYLSKPKSVGSLFKCHLPDILVEYPAGLSTSAMVDPLDREELPA